MTRRTNYRGFVCENTNQEVRIVSSYLTRLKKTARAGKYGKDLFCPYCNHKHTVYHFSWSALSCHHCNRTIEKLDWWVSSNPQKFSKRVTLCYPKVKYYIDKNSVGEVSHNGQRLDAKYSPNSINSHF